MLSQISNLGINPPDEQSTIENQFSGEQPDISEISEGSTISQSNLTRLKATQPALRSKQKKNSIQKMDKNCSSAGGSSCVNSKRTSRRKEGFEQSDSSLYFSESEPRIIDQGCSNRSGRQNRYKKPTSPTTSNDYKIETYRSKNIVLDAKQLLEIIEKNKTDKEKFCKAVASNASEFITNIIKPKNILFLIGESEFGKEIAENIHKKFENDPKIRVNCEKLETQDIQKNDSETNNDTYFKSIPNDSSVFDVVLVACDSKIDILQIRASKYIFLYNRQVIRSGQEFVLIFAEIHKDLKCHEEVKYYYIPGNLDKKTYKNTFNVDIKRDEKYLDL